MGSCLDLVRLFRSTHYTDGTIRFDNVDRESGSGGDRASIAIVAENGARCAHLHVPRQLVLSNALVRSGASQRSGHGLLPERAGQPLAQRGDISLRVLARGNVHGGLALGEAHAYAREVTDRAMRISAGADLRA